MAIWKGSHNPTWGGHIITRLIKHLSFRPGMILQVDLENSLPQPPSASRGGGSFLEALDFSGGFSRAESWGFSGEQAIFLGWGGHIYMSGQIIATSHDLTPKGS